MNFTRVGGMHILVYFGIKHDNSEFHLIVNLRNKVLQSHVGFISIFIFFTLILVSFLPSIRNDFMLTTLIVSADVLFLTMYP